jgi:hypothetical protein
VSTVTRIPQEPFAVVKAMPSATLNQVREIMLVEPVRREDAQADETATPSDAVTDTVADEVTVEGDDDE